MTDEKITVTYEVGGVVGQVREFESDAKALSHARNQAELAAEEKGVDMVRENPGGETVLTFKVGNESWTVAVEEMTFFDKVKEKLGL